MGISIVLVDLIQKALPPFDQRKSQKILVIGNQDCYFSYEKLLRYLTKNDVKHQIIAKEEILYTEGFKWADEALSRTTYRNFVHQKTLFETLGFQRKNVISLDFSDYEHADIIHDLNKPISKKLESKYDIIFDSGSVEHVFSIEKALRNFVSMLKPRGLIIQHSPIDMIDHGYYNFTAELFEDFFTVNNFEIKFSSYITWYHHSLGKEEKFYYVQKPRTSFVSKHPSSFFSSYFGCFSNLSKIDFQIPQQGYYSSLWTREQSEMKSFKKHHATKRLARIILFYLRRLYPFLPTVIVIQIEKAILGLKQILLRKKIKIL